jgi:hypothetical protein
VSAGTGWSSNATPPFTGSRAPEQWEYRFVLLERVETLRGRWRWALGSHQYDTLQDAIRGYLNGLGKDGWESVSVVAMSPSRDQGLWFKRPLV